MASKSEIGRILQPGHKFRNLNPFWVLGIPHTTAKGELKAAYRRKSLAVHPDKHPDDPRAEDAFNALKSAYDTLTSSAGAYGEFQRLVVEAEGVVGRMQRKKERAAARERRAVSPFDAESALQVEICQRIADAQAEVVVAKRMHEAEMRARAEKEERRKRKRTVEKVFQEEWEKDREARVHSWRKFSGKKSGKKGKGKKGKRKSGLKGRKETPAIPAIALQTQQDRVTSIPAAEKAKAKRRKLLSSATPVPPSSTATSTSTSTSTIPPSSTTSSASTTTSTTQPQPQSPAQ